MDLKKYNPHLIEVTDEELNSLTKDDIKELATAYPISYTSKPYLRYKYVYRGNSKDALGTYSTMFNLLQVGYTVKDISSKLKHSISAEHAPKDLGQIKPLELKPIEEVKVDDAILESKPDTITVDSDNSEIPLELLTKEDLQLMCDNRGIEYDKRMGAKKLIELLK